MHVLILGGGSCNFQPCFRGGSVIFVPKGGGESCVFYQPHFQMLRPTPLYFLTSPLTRGKHHQGHNRRQGVASERGTDTVPQHLKWAVCNSP